MPLNVDIDFDPVLDIFGQLDCQYYSRDDFNDNFEDEHDNFTIIHQNIRSFNRNGDELIMYLNQLSVNIDVLILTETWFSSGNVSDIPGYRGYHTHRDDRYLHLFLLT
jgi:hypothetical protein